jgi:hypothetical protein
LNAVTADGDMSELWPTREGMLPSEVHCSRLVDWRIDSTVPHRSQAGGGCLLAPGCATADGCALSGGGIGGGGAPAA